MKHEGIYHTLLGVFNPLSMKVLLLLYDRPYTKMELYGECKKWNNAVVKAVLDMLVQHDLLSGGTTRGDAYRLTLKGRSVGEWLLEGGLTI